MAGNNRVELADAIAEGVVSVLIGDGYVLIGALFDELGQQADAAEAVVEVGVGLAGVAVVVIAKLIQHLGVGVDVGLFDPRRRARIQLHQHHRQTPHRIDDELVDANLHFHRLFGIFRLRVA